MNVKLFTHTDLDGYGCAIVANLMFSNIDIEYCGYTNINQKIAKFFSSGEFNDYTHIFITDLSVSDEIAEVINRYNNYSVLPDSNTPYTVLIDHHPTAKHLGDKYEWCTVTPEYGDGSKACGASLFYKTIKEYDMGERDCFSESLLREFVELVRRYDTWEWKTVYNDESPRQLNELFKMYGQKKFFSVYTTKIIYGDNLFEELENELIRIADDRIEEAVDNASKRLYKRNQIINGRKYKFGVLFLDSDISIVGNKLCERHDDLDFVMMISGMSTISFRTVKDDIDLGKDVASFFGGGGHPKTAGAQISIEYKNFIIEEILKSETSRPSVR